MKYHSKNSPLRKTPPLGESLALQAVGVFSSIPIILFLTLASTTSYAASIIAHVDSNDVVVGQSIVMEVIVEGSRSAEPELPPLPDFDVSPRGKSSQFSMVNGKTSSRVTYTYVLAPKMVGQFAIGAIAATVDQQKILSSPFVINVREPSASIPNQRANNDDPIFVEASLSSNTVYIGQQIIYTFTFHRRIDITGAELREPTLQGIRIEQIQSPPDEVRTVNGQREIVSIVRRIFFPEAPGIITIPGAALTVTVPENRQQNGFRDPFGGVFGNTASRQHVIAAKPLQLTVKSLPTPPQEFTGLIGNFSITSTVMPTDLVVGGSATLTVTVQGEGNVKNITQPSITFPSGIKFYPDTPEEHFSTTPTGISGNRIYRFALVASAPGKLIIPAPSLAFFDPKTEQYKTVTANEQTLNITGVASPALEEPKGAQAPEQTPQKPFPWRTLGMIIAAIASALCSIWLTRIIKNSIKNRAQKLPAIRKRALADADHSLKNASITDPHQIQIILNNFFSQFLELPIGDASNLRLVREKLAALGIQEDELKKLDHLKIKIDTAIYGGGQLKTDDITEICNLLNTITSKTQYTSK